MDDKIKNMRDAQCDAVSTEKPKSEKSSGMKGVIHGFRCDKRAVLVQNLHAPINSINIINAQFFHCLFNVIVLFMLMRG